MMCSHDFHSDPLTTVVHNTTRFVLQAGQSAMDLAFSEDVRNELRVPGKHMIESAVHPHVLQTCHINDHPYLKPTSITSTASTASTGGRSVSPPLPPAPAPQASTTTAVPTAASPAAATPAGAGTIKSDKVLANQARSFLAQAAGVQARREWMQRRCALQAQYDSAKAADQFVLCAKLGKSKLVLESESAQLSLSMEDYSTLSDAHTQLVGDLTRRCKHLVESEQDFDALESLSQLLESLQALDAADLVVPTKAVYITDECPTPTGKRTKKLCFSGVHT